MMVGAVGVGEAVGLVAVGGGVDVGVGDGLPHPVMIRTTTRMSTRESRKIFFILAPFNSFLLILHSIYGPILSRHVRRYFRIRNESIT